jgi:hypothetical protein
MNKNPKISPVILLIIGMFISLIGQMLFSAFTAGSEKFENSVSKQYVDEKDEDITMAFRQGDKQVKEYCTTESQRLQKCVDSKVSKDQFEAFATQLNTIHLYILNNKNK